MDPVATKEIAPLRVWLFALAILAILAILAVILFVVLNDPFIFFADSGIGIACHAGATVRFLRHVCA